MFKIRIRAIVGMMMFFGYFVMYIVRYDLSVHILDLAHLLKGVNSTIKNRDITAKVMVKMRMRKYFSIHWDDWKIAYLLSSYHVGYCVCFPIFHNIGDRLGPTWVVGISGVVSGLLNCITPAATHWSFWVVFILRICIGFCAGAMQPNMVQLLRHWVPPVERNHFMWAYCGVTTGTFSTFLICAAVQYYSNCYVGFYIVGSVQIAWSLAWLLVITDYPEKHPCIQLDELTYLKNSIGTIFTIKITNNQAPWYLILRSIPFWSLCVLNFGYAWILIATCLHGPLFYATIGGYTISIASVLTAFPFFLRLLVGAMVIQFNHWYNQQPERRARNISKYYVVVSHVLPGLLLTGTWMSNICPGPVLITIAIAFTAAGIDHAFTLCHEISPNYANSINTVIRIIGNIPGIIIPISVGEVTHKYNNVITVWKHIWCFHALILLLSGIIFLIWGDANVQPWNALKRSRVRHLRPLPRPSTMSNIAEVDEDNYSISTLSGVRPFQQKKNSFLSKSFKLSQTRL